MQVSSLSYGQQKAAADKKFDAEDQDIFVASCMVAGTKDGKVTTMATWTKGVTHALLPVADCIVFVMLEAKRLVVPWDRARELVSDLMLPTDWMPVRFEIREFPNDVEFEALPAVARTTLGWHHSLIVAARL
jgi:hypothetical protein